MALQKMALQKMAQLSVASKTIRTTFLRAETHTSSADDKSTKKNNEEGNRGVFWELIRWR